MKAKWEFLADMARAYIALCPGRPEDLVAQAVIECRESVYDLLTDEDVDAAIEKLTKEFAPSP